MPNMVFKSARHHDEELYYVPNALRSMASVTFFNVLKLTHKIAKASGASVLQLANLKQQFTDYATKLEATLDNNYNEDAAPRTFSENEEFLVLGLQNAGYVAFPLAIASYTAGYIAFPVLFTSIALLAAATAWVGLSPLLSQPRQLAPMIRNEFAPEFRNAHNAENTRGQGFFAQFADAVSNVTGNRGVAMPRLGLA